MGEREREREETVKCHKEREMQECCQVGRKDEWKKKKKEC